MATDYSDPINLAESLRKLASVSYWKVLQRRLDEFEKHRADSAHWYEQARNARNEGHKSEPWIAMAEESERTAEKYHHLMLEHQATYWDAARVIRSHMPELLGDFPLIDGQDCRSVCPVEAAKAMEVKWEKLLSTISATEERSTVAAEHDDGDKAGGEQSSTSEHEHGSPLTESDRLLLAKMLECNIDYRNPKSQPEIVTLTTGGISTKGLFDNLRKSKLIETKRNVGTWLTPKGIETAKHITGI